MKTGTKMHVALYVADLDRSIAFYESLFGRPAAKRHDDHAKFELDDPALVFSLMPRPDRAAPRALSHMGLRVASSASLMAERKRLEAAGVTLREESNTTCCYAVQDKLWATDPDGNEWEVYVLHEDVEVSRADAPAANACCQPS